MAKTLGFSFSLKVGSHKTRDDGVCALEAVAWLAGEKHTAYPECVCPVVAGFVRHFNDTLPDDATRTRLLGPLVPRLVGTRATADVEARRALLTADWALRQLAPLALDAEGFELLASTLRASAPLVDRASAARGYRAFREARAVSASPVLGAVVYTIEDAAKGAWLTAAENAADAATQAIVGHEEGQGAPRTMAIELIEGMLAIAAPVESAAVR